MALTLRQGDSGSAVATLQQALNAAGYSEVKVDGKYGKDTKEAVALYQAMNGLKVDGIAGRKTLAKLLGTSSPDNNPELDGVLRKGSTGAAVRELQTLLAKYKYPVGTVDGTFGVPPTDGGACVPWADVIAYMKTERTQKWWIVEAEGKPAALGPALASRRILASWL